MSDEATLQNDEPEAPSTLTDRSLRLRVFGTLLVLGGLAFGGLALLSLTLTFAMPEAGAGAAADRNTMFAGVLVYLFGAVLAIVLGIGSWAGRRWAHAIILANAWIGLIVGGFSMLMLIGMYPTLATTLEQAAVEAGDSAGTEAAEGVMAVVLFIVLVFSFFFYVVLPGIFVLAYRGRDVRLTCERLDPRARWTDRVPIPLLCLVVLCGSGAVWFPLVSFYPSMPFFGVTIRGLPLVALSVVGAVGAFVLAVGLARRRPLAWWCTVVLLVLGTTSTVFTFGTMEAADIYRDWGFAGPELAMIEGMLASSVMRVMTLVSFVGWFVYVIWLRRYFRTPETA